MRNNDCAFFDDDSEGGPQDQRRALIQGLSRFLKVLVNQDGKALTKINPQTIGLRTISALWAIDPTLFSEACKENGVSVYAPSSCQLARSIKVNGECVSAAIISRYACEFRDALSIQTASMRTPEQRDRHAIGRYKVAKITVASGVRGASRKGPQIKRETVKNDCQVVTLRRAKVEVVDQFELALA